MKSGKYLPVVRYHFGSQFAVRVLQLSKRRDVGKRPHQKQHEQKQGYRC